MNFFLQYTLTDIIILLDLDEVIKKILNSMVDVIEKNETETSEQTLMNEKQYSVIQNRPVLPTSNSPDSTSPQTKENIVLFYNIKWIRFKHKKLPIILQNENGPCPLISISNILFLREDLKLKPDLEVISNSKLIELLADSLFNHFLPQKTSRQPLDSKNMEIILNDTLGVMEKLQYGLDVNVKFSSSTAFEYTPELDLFDLFSVHLYHGWLIDPEQTEIYEMLANKSYNQLIELIISGGDENFRGKLLAEQFLDTTASQMTFHGLASLHESLRKGELATLFRNNHFSTIYKNPDNDQLYLLITDNGYLNHEEIVWETLDNIDNDGRLCNSFFVEKNRTSNAASSNSIESKVDTTNE